MFVLNKILYIWNINSANVYATSARFLSHTVTIFCTVWKDGGSCKIPNNCLSPLKYLRKLQSLLFLRLIVYGKEYCFNKQQRSAQCAYIPNIMLNQEFALYFTPKHLNNSGLFSRAAAFFEFSSCSLGLNCLQETSWFRSGKISFIKNCYRCITLNVCFKNKTLKPHL